MKTTSLIRFLSVIAVLVLTSISGNAVTVSTPVLPQNAFAIEIKEPSQSFYCRDARKITHISLQKYITAQISEGSRASALPQYVTEVTIDFADSPLQIRIYAMEEFDPIRIAQKTSAYSNARSRAKTTVNKLTKSNVTNIAEYIPVKTYPLSTHAKTIEFRIPNSDEVEEFYKLINIYYLRDRLDRQYFGAIKSSTAKILNQKNFLGLVSPNPAEEWEKEEKSRTVTAGTSKILVSGLSGLLFTLGTPDTVATEIERQDVNKNNK